MNVTQKYRKENGLCLMCGDRAVPGKTRCIGCAQIEAVKKRLRMEERSEEQKKASKEYLKRWQQENPERMKVYRSRKAEYNRRYLYGGLDG